MEQPSDDPADPTLEHQRWVEHQARPVLVQLARLEGKLDIVADAVTGPAVEDDAPA